MWKHSEKISGILNKDTYHFIKSNHIQYNWSAQFSKLNTKASKTEILFIINDKTFTMDN